MCIRDRFSPDDAPLVHAALRERPAYPTALFDYRLTKGTVAP